MTEKKTSWLTPAAEAWEARMGKGSFPGGQAAKYLHPLRVAGHDMETVAAHLSEYLDRTNPQFVSLARFAMTFQQWQPGAARPEERRKPQADALPLVDDTGVLRI